MDYKTEIYKICDKMTQFAFDIATQKPDFRLDVPQFTETTKHIENDFRSLYNIMCTDETVSGLLKYETERIARNMCAMNYIIFSRIKENTPVEAMQRARLHAISWIGYLIKRIKLAIDGKSIKRAEDTQSD